MAVGRRVGQRFDADHEVTTEATIFLGKLDPEALGESLRYATHYEPTPLHDALTASPTPGRTTPPQWGHRGGRHGCGTVSSLQSSVPEGHAFQQRTCQIDPCRRMSRSAPARSCKPSTFCVMSVNPGRSCVHCARM